jgi:transcriptional regulator with XRE-family HTH domain
MNNIKFWRKYRGWSIRELARRADLSDVCIHSLETGLHKDPRISTLQKLAGALYVTVQDLIEGEDDD